MEADPPAKPKRKRNPPLDRRKLPVYRAMIEICDNHKLEDQLKLIYQLGWKLNRRWEFGVPWDDQIIFQGAMHIELRNFAGLPYSHQELIHTMIINGPRLAKLFDETVTLCQYYESRSTAQH